MHQSSITAAVLLAQSQDPEIVRMRSDLSAVRRLFRRLSQRGVPLGCYEASGAGHALKRTLDRDGLSREVIAPSLIPRKPSERRKNDRLDATVLARLYRSAHLTPVAVPDKEQEAVKPRVRTRLAIHQHITRLKHRIAWVLAGHGLGCTGTRSNWTKQQRSLDAEIEELSQSRTWRSGVHALRCFRDIKTLTAVTILTEIGDVRCFRSARGLMAYAGLVPSERSSGDVERKGPITKAGNAFLGRILVESAWHYRHRAGADLILKRRRQGHNTEILAITPKAQHRPSRRFRHLAATKHTNKAVTAVARELTGFIWAALQVATDEGDLGHSNTKGKRRGGRILVVGLRQGISRTRGSRQRLLQMDPCVCGTQPADIGPSHRRTTHLPRNDGAP